MRVIIVGAGEVGYSIAEDLSTDHDVVLIDEDPDRVTEVHQSLDVLAITGDGSALPVLREAGMERSELFIACTDNDEANIVCSNIAEAAGDPFTIARVQKTHLLETWSAMPGIFGVDYLVSTDLLTAQTIANVSGLPAARDVNTFEDGLVQLVEFEIPADSPIADQSVEEADQFDSLTFVAVIRDTEIEIASGQTILHPGDDVVVIGNPESVQRFAKTLHPDETPGEEDIVVVGGSDIGFLTARLLEERGFRPRLVEQREDRAKELAEELAGTMVLHSDATDVEFLDREHIGEADVLVAALPRDEDNLLISLLSKHEGVTRAIGVVDRIDYVDLFEAVGVDVAVNPRELAAEEITRHTTHGHLEQVALIHHDRAEAVEIEIDADSPLAGRVIRDAVTELPDQVVIGAIIRDKTLVIPRGDTVINAGDHVILFADVDQVEATVSAV